MTTMKIKNRLAKDKAMLWVVCLFAALTAVPLFAILGEVFVRGFDQLSWSFFTEPTPTAYKAMKAIEAGEKDAAKVKEIIENKLNTCALAKIDYVEVVSFDTIQPIEIIEGAVLIAIAVYIGTTRLIDNRIIM